MDKRKQQRVQGSAGFFERALVKRKGVLSRYRSIEVLDVSETGIRFVTDFGLMFEEALVVSLESHAGEHFCFHGAVKYCRENPAKAGTYIVGLEYSVARSGHAKWQLPTQLMSFVGYRGLQLAR